MNHREAYSPESLTDDQLQAHAAALGERLRDASLSVATAESCTGGWIAKTFTDVAGSSDWFDGGLVTYSDEAKQRLLGVTLSALEKHGAVSEPVVRQMALGALSAVGVDCAVSVSGVAGPGGGTPDKPVGMVWMAAAVRRKRSPGPSELAQESTAPETDGERVEARVHQFAGSRDDVRRATVVAAMELLTQVLDSD